MPGHADRVSKWQRRYKKGGENPTESLLEQTLVVEAAFEDIFGEATGEGFEDILT